ncbi:zinc ABC transporter substrate-binding protein [Blastococcus sp. CT_GayMR16]|uniref:metal ABC transporter solute-binding protein, Zn/Mn family n=1 Tax=Blastococcus sp. CT_GayMR16 TaxID=2559607 RepID=UPI001073C2A8|nr:zinc ABC transporter substrate-binding protein [Blastococcus sp. CT_GayMR16]TFV86401.1 ABC transporter substrate-binding protein [Blastococcus sp. CT_GayMR16]
MPRARTTAVRTAVALTTLAVAACSGGSDDGSTVATGNADACPGEVVDVVVSVGQWSDVVRSIGGDCANVTTIVASGAVDPHDFEPGTADLAAFSDADLVVVNGADYDSWAEDAVESQDPAPAVLDVADLVDAPDGADPHLWYEPEAVHAIGPALADELTRASPDAAPFFEERAAAWQAGLRPYLDAVLALGSSVSGRTYAATEPVFDRMAAALGLVDATPEGYRRASSNDSDPAPGDLAAFESALADGSVDVLIYNTQTSGSVPEQLRAAAEAAGVPVVEVSESPPDASGSFIAWQLAQFSDVSDALAGAP